MSYTGQIVQVSRKEGPPTHEFDIFKLHPLPCYRCVRVVKEFDLNPPNQIRSRAQVQVLSAVFTYTFWVRRRPRDDLSSNLNIELIKTPICSIPWSACLRPSPQRQTCSHPMDRGPPQLQKVKACQLGYVQQPPSRPTESMFVSSFICLSAGMYLIYRGAIQPTTSTSQFPPTSCLSYIPPTHTS